MKILILSIILVVFSVPCLAANNHIYNIQLEFDKGNISYSSVSVTLDTFDLIFNESKGDYLAQILSFENDILITYNFNFPTMILFDEIDSDTGEIIGGGIKNVEKAEKLIQLPYYENAKEIIIYDKDLNKKLTIDVSSYAKTIPKEPEEKPIIKEEKERTIEKIPKTEKKPTNNTLFIVFGLIVFIILLFIIMKIIHYKKNN